MKKIIAFVFIINCFYSFAQTNEINNLTRIINTNRLTENNLVDYVRISKQLNNLVVDDSSILYAAFFEQNLPLVYIQVKGKNTFMENYLEVTSPNFISNYLETINAILLLEQKSANKILTEKLFKEKETIFSKLNNFANQLQENKSYNEASKIFFNLASFEISRIDAEYEISKTTNLENLEIKREVIYKNALLNLEKAYSISVSNEQAKSLLLKTYNFLKMEDKIKALK